MSDESGANSGNNSQISEVRVSLGSFCRMDF